MQVRWRRPIMEEETALLEEIAGLLERAYRLAPTLRYPWWEWQEILEHLERRDGLAESIARRAREATDAPLIGYRRRNVTVTVPGGWEITLPGSLAETWDSEQGTWLAWEEGREVHFSSYRFDG